ncbi:MAG: CPBP family intramembrane glutamic endopeptidase [Micropepsaceae bacterium]
MWNNNNSVVALIRSLPPRAEFWIVIGIAFGLFIFRSIIAALNGGHDESSGGWGLIGLALYEVAVGTVLAVFLYIRGWRLHDLGFQWPRLRDTGEALVLVAATYAASMTLWYTIGSAVGTPLASSESIASDLATGLPTVLAFSFLNGFFEEVFVCAYVLSAWRGPTMWNAISASAGIRMAYHLYQGPFNALTIGVLGLIFAWFYATRGRIWPLIIAHALLDFIYLLPYATLL